jgi:probable rRNA maturation factor
MIRDMTSGVSVNDSANPPFRIQILNRQKQFRISSKTVTSLCSAALSTLRQPALSLSISYVSIKEMHALNLQYLGRDYATDVLSFPYKDVIIDSVPFIGEIVIAPEIAVKQALRYRISPDKELRKLLLHGILHLLGYDHERDKGRMNRLQRQLMRRRFFLNSYSGVTLKAGK